MKLIVGLGNPEASYKNNRHNVGFLVLDELAKKLRVKNFEFSQRANAQYAWTSLKGIKIELFKPQTFMNNSGYSVLYAYKKHSVKLGDLYVIHDDLDIHLGSYKIQKGRGPKLHNGINSIERELGSEDFWRVRVGVDNRHSEIAESISRGPVRGAKHALTGKEYVLQDFTEEEFEIINQAFKKIVKELMTRLTVTV